MNAVDEREGEKDVVDEHEGEVNEPQGEVELTTEQVCRALQKRCYDIKMDTVKAVREMTNDGSWTWWLIEYKWTRSFATPDYIRKREEYMRDRELFAQMHPDVHVEKGVKRLLFDIKELDPKKKYMTFSAKEVLPYLPLHDSDAKKNDVLKRLARDAQEDSCVIS